MLPHLDNENTNYQVRERLRSDLYKVIFELRRIDDKKYLTPSELEKSKFTAAESAELIITEIRKNIEELITKFDKFAKSNPTKEQKLKVQKCLKEVMKNSEPLIQPQDTKKMLPEKQKISEIFGMDSAENKCDDPDDALLAYD